MGSQTAHGFPYPVGTDRVMDGDNAIQALAEKIDTLLAGMLVQGGAIPAASGTATSWSGSVTFPEPFAATPLAVVITGVSSSATVVWMLNGTGTTTGFSWFAQWNNLASQTNSGNARYMAIGARP